MKILFKEPERMNRWGKPREGELIGPDYPYKCGLRDGTVAETIFCLYVDSKGSWFRLIPERRGSVIPPYNRVRYV